MLDDRDDKTSKPDSSTAEGASLKFKELDAFNETFLYPIMDAVIVALLGTLFIENDMKANLNKFKPAHARAVRKAKESGVEIKVSQDVKSFYAILKENLNIRHGVDPTHTIQELYNLIDLFPNSINLFGAFYKGEMIAGVLNFIIKDDVALAFYISHKEKFQELRPLNFLFYSIFEWCIKEKIKVYDFGIFTVDGEPNMGLGRFKENFGASGIFRDTFQIIF